jgi:hypothetical protein
MGVRRRQTMLVFLALAALMLVALPAASAMASASVRLVNARGGSDPVSLSVTVGGQKTPVGAATTFGQAGELTTVPAGEAQLALTGGSGSSASVSVQKTLTDGDSYTVIAVPKGSNGYALEVLPNGKASAGTSKLRMLHAAPELGSPDVRLGDRTIAQDVKFRQATDYLQVDPGSYQLALTKHGGGSAVLKTQVSLAAGTSTTVVVAGSGGSAARFIQVNDDTVTPTGAPHTGLGDLARGGGEPWLAALIAALLAGAAGGLVQLRRTRS